MKLDKKAYFIVGIVVLISFLILLLGMYKISDIKFKEGMSFYVIFDFANGLIKNSPVMVSGVKLGKVKEIEFINIDNETKVRLKIWLDDQVKIKKDAKVYINQAGLMGEKYVEIDAGSNGVPEIKNDEVLIGVEPQKIDKIIKEASNVLEGLNTSINGFNDVFIEKDVKKRIRDSIKNFASSAQNLNSIIETNKSKVGLAIDDFQTMTNSLNNAAKDVNSTVNNNVKKVDKFISDLKLFGNNIKDLSVANKIKINNLIENLEAASYAAKDTLEKNKKLIESSISKFEKTSEVIETLMSGEKENIQTIIKELTASSKNIKTSTEQVSLILKNNSNEIVDAIKNINIAVKNMSEGFKNISAMVDTVKNGEGLVGKMIFDKKIGNKLEGMVNDLEVTVKYIKHHPGIILNRNKYVSPEDYQEFLEKLEKDKKK